MKLPGIIVCPVCEEKLTDHDVDTARKGLVCRSCGTAYPIDNDIADFRVTKAASTAMGWSVEGFEQAYEAYEDWDSIYDWDEKRGIPREASAYKYDLVKGRILDQLQPKPGGRIFDLGCGNGYFLLDIRRRLCTSVANLTYVGLDASRHNIENFKKKLLSEGAEDVHPLLGTAERLPIESGTVDVVVSSEVLEHIADKESALKEVYRILAPGGTFLFTTPSRTAIRNWDIVLSPLRLVRRLSQLRFRRRGNPSGYDQPLSNAEYAAMLARAGLAGVDLKSEQMLNDELTSRLPKRLVGAYIASTRAVERRSAAARNLFGLHIIGSARK